MQRKIVLAYLLFSLFFFLFILFFVSCFAPSSGVLAKLADEGKYVQLEQKTATMLAKRIGAEPLYYRALALHQGEEAQEAYHILHLYFAMAKGDDQHLESAHRLMSSLALEVDRPALGIASARWLQERNLLQEVEARAYYQGLLALDEQAEATKVFSEFLAGTIDTYAYAEMLLNFSASEQTIVETFSTLSSHEQLRLLQSVASDTVNYARAIFLLSLATPLEQAFEGSPELGQVYHLLATLYGYADKRVQGRKYTTLAKTFR